MSWSYESYYLSHFFVLIHFIFSHFILICCSSQLAHIQIIIIFRVDDKDKNVPNKNELKMGQILLIETRLCEN